MREHAAAGALPGELMMIGFEGTDVTPALAEWIARRHVGGVVLFSRNLKSMGQAAKLISDMQKLRATVSAEALFVAVDQEGGAVSRIVPGMTVLPGNMALGSIGSEDSAYAAGRITAAEMATLGFNVNFAPVADVSCEAGNLVVGVRSFGDEPGQVGRLAGAMIEGLHAYGMLATAKHFPGLGACAVDPHQDLPVVSAQESQILERDLAPFAAAIKAGVKIIMTSHAVYRCWEKTLLPATMSERIVTGLLRKRLGYDGIVLSDDVEMGALMRYFTPEEIARQSVAAGVDMLQSCHTQAAQLATFEALRQALQEGGDLAHKMRQSAKRVQAVKAALPVQRQAVPHVSLQTLGLHRQLAQRMGRDAVTLVKDAAGLIPLEIPKHKKILVLEPAYALQTQVEEDIAEETDRRGAPPALLSFFRRLHPNTQWRRFNVSPSQSDMDHADHLDGFEVVLLLTYNAHLYPRQMAYAKKIVAAHRRVIVAAIRNPYDLMELGDAAAGLATYGFRDCSLKALVEVLFGEVLPKGKMPVCLE